MRRSFTLFSIVVHAVVISAALIAQVLAVGTLPTPHQPLMFDASHIMPVDIQLPAPPRVRPVDTASPAVSENAAPSGRAKRCTSLRQGSKAHPPPSAGIDSRVLRADRPPPSMVWGSEAWRCRHRRSPRRRFACTPA